MNWTNHFGGSEKLARFGNNKARKNDFVIRQFGQSARHGPRVKICEKKKGQSGPSAGLDIASCATMTRIGNKCLGGVSEDRLDRNATSFSKPKPTFVHLPDNGNYNNDDDSDFTEVEPLSSSSMFSSPHTDRIFPLNIPAKRDNFTPVKRHSNAFNCLSPVLEISSPISQRRDLPTPNNRNSVSTFFETRRSNDVSPYFKVKQKNSSFGGDLSESSSDGYITEAVSFDQSRNKKNKSYFPSDDWNRSLFGRQTKSIAEDSIFGELFTCRPFDCEDDQSVVNWSGFDGNSSSVLQNRQNNIETESKKSNTENFLPESAFTSKPFSFFLENNQLEIKNTSTPNKIAKTPSPKNRRCSISPGAIKAALQVSKPIFSPEKRNIPAKNELSPVVTATCGVQTDNNEQFAEKMHIFTAPHPAVVFVLDEIVAVICATEDK